MFVAKVESHVADRRFVARVASSYADPCHECAGLGISEEAEADGVVPACGPVRVVVGVVGTLDPGEGAARDAPGYHLRELGMARRGETESFEVQQEIRMAVAISVAIEVERDDLA